MDAFALAALLLAFALGNTVVAVAADLRADSAPQSGDATVAVAFTLAGWPTDGQTAVTMTIADPGPVPAPARASLRRALLPGGRPRTTVAIERSRGIGVTGHNEVRNL